MRYLRAQKGLSLVEVGKAIGSKPQNIGNWENDVCPPRMNPAQLGTYLSLIEIDFEEYLSVYKKGGISLERTD